MAVVLSTTASVSTPNRLVLVVTSGGAETQNFTVANLRAFTTVGTPLDTALAATLGTTNTNTKAQAALITGGSYVSAGAGTPTVQSFINTTCTNGLAAAAGFAPITIGACAIFSGTNPTLQISVSALTVADQEPLCIVQNVFSAIR
jgi:hypothetical protein